MKIAPLSMIYVLMLAFNNLCLNYVEVTFYQVFIASADSLRNSNNLAPSQPAGRPIPDDSLQHSVHLLLFGNENIQSSHDLLLHRLSRFRFGCLG